MKIEQAVEPEQKVNPEQPQEVIPNEKADILYDKSGGDVSLDKGNIPKRIWAYVLQNPGGTSGWFVAIIMSLTFAYNIYNNKTQEESKWTSEKIIELVKIVKSGESSQLEKFLENIKENPKTSAVDRAVVEAYRLKQVGRIDDSIGKWRSIADISEGSDNDLAAGAWFSAGYLRVQQGKYEKAISDFSKGLNLKPDYVEVHYSRGAAKLNIGKFKEAIDDFSKVLELDSNYVEAYYSRGFAKLSLSKHEDARADFRKALDLKPDYVEAKWGLKETELYLKTIEPLDPKAANAEAYYSRGAAKLNLGQYKKAIADFRKALDLQPDYVEAYYGRGAAKFSIGQYQSAVDDYTTVIDLNSELPSVYANRGEAKIKLGQYKSAIADCDEAIRLDPDYAYAYYIRGEAKFSLERIEEGESDIETASKLAEEAGNEKLKDQIELKILIKNLSEHYQKKDETLDKNNN